MLRTWLYGPDSMILVCVFSFWSCICSCCRGSLKTVTKSSYLVSVIGALADTWNTSDWLDSDILQKRDQTWNVVERPVTFFFMAVQENRYGLTSNSSCLGDPALHWMMSLVSTCPSISCAWNFPSPYSLFSSVNKGFGFDTAFEECWEITEAWPWIVCELLSECKIKTLGHRGLNYCYLDTSGVAVKCC